MISGLVARARSLWRGMRGDRSLDMEMSAEFRVHREMRADDLERAGLSRAEAERQARVEFGSPDHYKDMGREARGLRRFDQLQVSWLDFKLGFRMLARYPGLTLVGGLAMAFAIWIGAGTFELATQLIRPAIPLDEGRRIVGVRTWDVSTNRAESRVAHDFLAWRSQLTSIEDLGAFVTQKRNLITADGRAEPVNIAEMTASGFEVARVAPLYGRVLTASDESPSAPAVAVIGHDLWQSRFNGDRNVVGQTVRVAAVHTTIVGVMPEGFQFPLAFNFWTPLKLDASRHARREGPGMAVFGRLAPGVSMSEAQVELTTIGQRTAADHRDTHQHLRPQVMAYAKSILDVTGWKMVAAMSANLPVILLLVLICANVALLMFARAATRETEIVVRSALGATRSRIIMQLFAEALVLGGVAAVIGLAATGFGLRWVKGVVEGELLKGNKLPFWFTDQLSTPTIVYSVLLTIVAAVIAGVMPGFKVTRGVGARLKSASAGGGGPRFGGLWTAVIVAQVAVTVAFPVVTYMTQQDAKRIRSMNAGFPKEQYLSLRLEMDREGGPDTTRAAFLDRYRQTYQDLERRLAANPAVAGVTYGDRLPLMYHPHRIVEIDAGGGAPLNPQWPNGYRVSAASVAPNFFDVFQAPILNGRPFHASEFAQDQRVVIVNESFVRLVFGNRNPIGRRFRYVFYEERDAPKGPNAAPEPWHEIIGVTRDMGNGRAGDPKVSGVYHPAAAGPVYPTTVAVWVKSDAASFAPQLQFLAAQTDPTLRLHDLTAMDRLDDAELHFMAFWFRMLLIVSGIALTLSLAGIYSVMSFTVSRRTREIGVRVALGASPRRVLMAIFPRPLLQISGGVAAGALLIMLLMLAASSNSLPLRAYLAIAGYALVMFGVCMLACVVPTRRALAVQPTEALRAEG